MSQLERKIAEKIIEIVEKRLGKAMPVLSGKVVEVDEESMTATVQLTIDSPGTPTDVVLNVTMENTSGLYGIPAENADCLVAAVDGGFQLLSASEYTKVYMKAGTLIQLNDGGNGGVPLSASVSSQLNVPENEINSIKTAFNSMITTLSGTPTAPMTNGTLAGFLTGAFGSFIASLIVNTVPSDLENPDITQ